MLPPLPCFFLTEAPLQHINHSRQNVYPSSSHSVLQDRTDEKKGDVAETRTGPHAPGLQRKDIVNRPVTAPKPCLQHAHAWLSSPTSPPQGVGHGRAGPGSAGPNTASFNHPKGQTLSFRESNSLWQGRGPSWGQGAAVSPLEMNQNSHSDSFSFLYPGRRKH